MNLLFSRLKQYDENMTNFFNETYSLLCNHDLFKSWTLSFQNNNLFKIDELDLLSFYFIAILLSVVTIGIIWTTLILNAEIDHRRPWELGDKQIQKLTEKPKKDKENERTRIDLFVKTIPGNNLPNRIRDSFFYTSFHANVFGVLSNGNLRQGQMLVEGVMRNGVFCISQNINIIDGIRYKPFIFDPVAMANYNNVDFYTGGHPAPIVNNRIYVRES